MERLTSNIEGSKPEPWRFSNVAPIAWAIGGRTAGISTNVWQQ
jgi:hypothetical protein